MNKEFKDQRILLVDNSSSMVLLIRHLLTRIGFDPGNIELSTDGRHAADLLESREFDLVTSSMFLKNLGVRELLGAVRSSDSEAVRRTPFVVISGQKIPGLVEEMKSLGASGFLGKPFQSDELGRMIEEVQSGDEFVCFSQKHETPGERKFQPGGPSPVAEELVGAFVDTALESFAQYMIQAEPGAPDGMRQVPGDISSLIDLTDEAHGIRLVLLLWFPREVACSIYEAIFGAVDLAMVCGVVEELGNIIGGVVKVKIADLSREIYQVTWPDREWCDGTQLNFQLGFPRARMDEESWDEVKEDSSPFFTVPFCVNGATVYLQVFFQQA